MKTLILWLIKKTLTPAKLAKLLAGVIASILRKASKTGRWDLFKAIIQSVEKACHLFNECYADEQMDKDDEERIAQAIEGIADKIDVAALIKQAEEEKA